MTKAIRDGEFFENPAITTAVDKASAPARPCTFLVYCPTAAYTAIRIILWPWPSCRPPRRREDLPARLSRRSRHRTEKRPELLELLDATFAKLGKGRIASLIGRYFAMDRDNPLGSRCQAYNLIVDGQSQFQADTAVAGLQAAYARDESDEFV